MGGLGCFTHDFTHVYIYTGKQFECLRHREHYLPLGGSILHHLCGDLALSATATATATVAIRGVLSRR